MTDKPLHADIVTAVMDCIEREGMISRGKLEQAVAGVLATRQDKAWTTAGDQRPRIDRSSGTREALLREYSHALSPSLVLDGVPLPEVKFNHKPTDKPIAAVRTNEAGENRNSVPSPSWVTEQQLRTFSLAPDFFTQDKKA